MTLRTTVIAVLATSLMAGAALARVPVVAKLEAPVAERTRVIANGAVWQCEGDSCTAVMTRAVNARACGELAEKVGRIVSFSGDDRAVTGSDLDRCNTKAPSLPETTSAAR